VHQRALDRDEGDAVDHRKWLPAAVIQHPTNLVTDTPGERPAILERNVIDAITGALQHHAALEDPLADAGERRVELSGMHQQRRVEHARRKLGTTDHARALARLGAC
jgi:hypothetical protein